MLSYFRESADGQTMANMTNLALKGIIGIKAMTELAEVAGESKDAKYYRNISETYIKKWEEYGMSRDGGRAKLAYDWYGSWVTEDNSLRAVSYNLAILLAQIAEGSSTPDLRQQPKVCPGGELRTRNMA